MEEVFAGFPYPKDEFVRIPNMFFEDELARVDNFAELKVILYVMRHTWGYQNYMEDEVGGFKKITTDEFMHGYLRKRDKVRVDSGTGLSDYAVRSGLKKAVEHGYLIEFIDDRDKARIKKYYALKMCE